MVSIVLQNKAEKFANQLVPLWVEAGKPVLAYPSTPKNLDENTNLDRVLRDHIFANDGLSIKQKELLSKCLDLAIEEKSKLQAKYSKNTFLKDCVKAYRDAIAALSGCDRDSFNLLPIAFFTPNRFDIRISNIEISNKVGSHRVGITDKFVDEILSVARLCILNDSDRAKDVYNKAISLELVTGRRQFSELCCRANFKVCDRNHVIFTGQSKGNLEKQNKEYVIPVLGIESQDVVKALNDVQQYLKNRPWYSEDLQPNDYKKKLNTNLTRAYDEKFRMLMLGLNSQQVLTGTHIFRKLYACIAHKRLSPNVSFNRYASEILGHDSESLGVKTLNRGTSDHYDLFYFE